MKPNPESQRWLSEAAEVLVSEILAVPAEPTHCDLLIVGSGYGAAVAAARFAGARRASDGAALRIYLLERGEEYLAGQFPATFAEVPGHVRFSCEDGRPARGKATGLFDLRIGATVSALLGNGLGGGSLINAAVMERPSADAFVQGWPPGMDGSALAPAYCAAEQMLMPEQIPERVPKLDSLLAAGDRLATLEPPRKAHVAIAFGERTHTPAQVAMEACLRCGDCVSGCNHRAKKSLDTNYLALASQRGVRLFCGGTAHRVRAMAGGGYAVEFFLTDRGKTRNDDAQLIELRARHVIVAAGALGSTELLLRSRAAGLPLSEQLGTGFSCNGDMIAVAHRQKAMARASAQEGDAPAQRHIGPTITGLLRVQPLSDTPADAGAPAPRPLAIEEFAIPGPLRRVFAEVVTSTAALHGLARIDPTQHQASAKLPDPLAVDDLALDHTAVYGLMGDDGAAGRLSLCAAPGSPLADGQLRIDWRYLGKVPVFKAQLAALQRAHAGSDGLGGQVLPNPLWNALPPFASLEATGLVFPGKALTVHPLGGCRIGRSNKDGVVDAYGRVFGGDATLPDAVLPGLAVLDGSIVPVSLGINPSLTIAALAEHAVPQLARAWGLVLATAGEVPAPSVRPLRRDVSAPRAPTPTCISLLERMSGRVNLGGKDFDLGAEVRFAPFDIRQLRRLPAVLPLNEIVLSFGATPDAPRARCTGKAEVLVREDSDAIERFLNCALLTGEKIRAFLDSLRSSGDAPLPEGALADVAALASHFGETRLIRYSWQVTAVDPGVPLRVCDQLVLTKRLAFQRRSNPWRQLTEVELVQLDGDNPIVLGRLAVDPGFFVEQMQPLLAVEIQQDMPNQLGDLVELALWLLRVVLYIHLPNFLPPRDVRPKKLMRLPGVVEGVAPEYVPLTAREPAATGLRRQLVRYAPSSPQALRPVLLIHGFGAGGSTFTHPAIGAQNLVGALLAAGREVWVVDLRTSIGFPPRDGDPFQSFDDVATTDIPDALRAVAQATHARGTDGRVDVVAHCIGAAMFSVAVLRSPDLHQTVGAVVLSQVGLLPRASALNRLRAFVATYLQKYLQVERFDTLLDDLPQGTRWLIDGVLATYPYPDDDGEADRLATAPPFAAVRHRADAIFGQTMRLANIGDALLGALADIYGFVSVRGLAQVGHYARRQVLTDIGGQNRVVAFEHIAKRFAFPLMLLHGRHNAVFDWRGALDSYKLLQQVFDRHGDPVANASAQPEGDIDLSARARRLLVLADYGHQDTLIGENAHRDVFPHIVSFLQGHQKPEQPGSNDPDWAVRLAWMGPWLGRASRTAAEPGLLRLRVALRPPPAHAVLRAVVLVPATRSGQRWSFETRLAVTLACDLEELQGDAITLWLKDSELSRFQGFAVLTAHDDLPTFAGKLRILLDKDVPDGLFDEPHMAPAPELRKAVEAALAAAQQAGTEVPLVRLDPAWIAAVQPADAPAQDSLCLALASCQYVPGLVDRRPAQASYRRLAQRLDDPSAPRPQLLLLIGDQVYVDDTAGLFDADGSDDPAATYLLSLRMPALRSVTSALPSYPLLDDHEVADNWQPEAPPTPAQSAALEAYIAFQHKLVGEPRDVPTQGPFDYTLAPAGFPVFMLDTRSQRGARSLSPGPQAVEQAALCTPAQMAALAQWLDSGPADVPKFVASAVTVFPMPRSAVFGASAERIGLDDWSGYPATQRALLTLIRQCKARHVVLLSGDRHLSSVSSLWLTRPDGTPTEVVSVVSSGLYAPWPFANARADEFWLDGALNPDDAQRNGFEASMLTAAVGTGNGFAQLQLQRDAAHGWRLEVNLDLDDGLRVCRRALGDAKNRRWQIG